MPSASKSKLEKSAGAEVGTDGFPVWLHVYDLGVLSKWMLNTWAKLGNNGAFHCGIEVINVEWCFQALTNCEDDDARTGVACHRAREHPRHMYRESVWLGKTPLSASEIRQLLLELEKSWLASSYHFVQRNCVDFAENLHRQLRVPQPFPPWVRGCSKGLLQHTPFAYQDAKLSPWFASCSSSEGEVLSCASLESAGALTSSCASCASKPRGPGANSADQEVQPTREEIVASVPSTISPKHKKF